MPTDFDEDLVEAAFWDVWKRIVTGARGADPEIPDPSVNFDGCIDAVFGGMRIECLAMAPVERTEWFLQQSANAVDFAKAAGLPDNMKDRAAAWRRRLLN